MAEQDRQAPRRALEPRGEVGAGARVVNALNLLDFPRTSSVPGGSP